VRTNRLTSYSKCQSFKGGLQGDGNSTWRNLRSTVGPHANIGIGQDNASPFSPSVQIAT